MTNKLIDAAKYYEGLPHQDKAWDYLAECITKDELEWFLALYRDAPPEKKYSLYDGVPIKLTSPFGQSSWRFHKGVDFAAWNEPPIYCVTPGVVLRAGGSATNNGDCAIGNKWCAGGWGNFVEIQTDKGDIARYCHLAQYSIIHRPGDRVEAGTPLGHQGTTGNSTGRHLHFEVVKNGVHVNPVGYIVDEKGVML